MTCDGRIRLVAFDLDGTLLRGDTVCTGIARGIGRLERMREMERGHELADGMSDVAEIASWYLPLGRQRIESELSRLTPAPDADEGCRRLRDAGVDLVIISVTWEFAVQHFAERFGASDYAATPLDWTTGKFDDFDAKHKGPWLEAKIASLGLNPDQVAAVGDSPNDFGMFQTAGTSFCVGVTCGEFDSVNHRPNANILQIAEEILAL